MVEHVKGTRHIDFKGSCQPYRLALRLGTEQVIQGLEGRHFACFRVLQVFPVHLAHTAVNDGTLHRLQAVLAADDQLHQRQDKVGFQRHRVFLVEAQINVHRVNVVGAVRGDLDDLSAQPLDKGRVFAHRVNHNDPVTGGKEHVHKLPLCGKGFAGARHAEEQAVGVFELFPVCHDDVMGKCVEPVIDGFAIHAELLRHKGNENGRGAGRHATLDLNAVMAQRKAGKKTVLLLEVQPLQGAVVFLDDTGHREQVIVQLPAGRGHVYHKEGQQEHSFIPAL